MTEADADANATAEAPSRLIIQAVFNLTDRGKLVLPFAFLSLLLQPLRRLTDWRTGSHVSRAINETATNILVLEILVRRSRTRPICVTLTKRRNEIKTLFG